MKHLSKIILLLIPAWFIQCTKEQKANEWIELFNGKDLTGWKANESPESFTVRDGNIVANGKRSHLIYLGEDGKADFKNFEFSIDVMTYHLTNSGVYFHTAYQEEGWLTKGYEMQINSTHHGAGDYKEVKKGGSLYSVRNVYKAFAKDSVWYTMNLRVVGKHIQVRIDGKLIVDYVEPVKPSRYREVAKDQDLLSHGTFALQGHDFESTAFFKNIRVKKLDDALQDSISVPQEDVFPRVLELQSHHFAFIDTNVKSDGTINLDSALQQFYATGINLGIVAHDSIFNDAAAVSAFTTMYNEYPVFLGLEINPVSTKQVVAEQRNQFDYIIGKIKADVYIKKPQIAMDNYVKLIVETLNKKNIDVWSSATVLPESLAKDYKTLWTKNRMTKVIEAARQNNVAIEISNTLRLPDIEFLKLAKEKGCRFANEGIYVNNKMIEPIYFMTVIDQCKLDYKDIYIPGN